MPKRTIKINLKLPSGVVATKDLVEKATKAAKDVVDSTVSDLAEARELARDLAKKGVHISAEELLDRKKTKARKSTGGPAKKAASRKRTVLSDAQKASLVEDLKKGMTINATAKKYGVSTATVTNLKSKSGLTRATKKKA